jgi:hypothetical protein
MAEQNIDKKDSINHKPCSFELQRYVKILDLQKNVQKKFFFRRKIWIRCN